MSRESPVFRYPSILSFQMVQQKMTDQRTLTYNLAIVAPVNSEWTTEQREHFVFEPILRPIYTELLRQIKDSAFFTGYNMPHEYYEVFTTGGNAGKLIEQYGDYLDAVEIHKLSLTLGAAICTQQEQIKKESCMIAAEVNGNFSLTI